MRHYFVPYTGHEPALTMINGHRLVIVSQDRYEMLQSLDIFGADRLEVVEAEEEREDVEHQTFEALATAIDGGVVVAPCDVQMHDLLDSLREELPWIQ